MSSLLFLCLVTIASRGEPVQTVVDVGPGSGIELRILGKNADIIEILRDGEEIFFDRIQDQPMDHSDVGIFMPPKTMIGTSASGAVDGKTCFTATPFVVTMSFLRGVKGLERPILTDSQKTLRMDWQSRFEGAIRVRFHLWLYCVGPQGGEVGQEPVTNDYGSCSHSCGFTRRGEPARLRWTSESMYRKRLMMTTDASLSFRPGTQTPSFLSSFVPMP